MERERGTWPTRPTRLRCHALPATAALRLASRLKDSGLTREAGLTSCRIDFRELRGRVSCGEYFFRWWLRFLFWRRLPQLSSLPRQPVTRSVILRRFPVRRQFPNPHQRRGPHQPIRRRGQANRLPKATPALTRPPVRRQSHTPQVHCRSWIWVRG